MSDRTQRLPRMVVAIGFLLLPACDKPMPEGHTPTYPTTGAVFVEGRPATGAFVMLHPVPDDPEAIRPNAVVLEDGSFSLSTYEAGDGAPEGTYTVTIAWPEPLPPEADDEMATEAPDQLGGKYSDPSSTGIQVKVRPEENSLERINLKW